MRVLLVNPRLAVSPEDFFEAITSLPPIGLTYLAAALTERGHELAIVDCLGVSPMPTAEAGDGKIRCGISDDEILTQVKEFRPELIGIGCAYTVHAEEASSVAMLVKNRYSGKVPVIMGGAHASTCPGEVLDNQYVDFVAVGEGEVTLTDLCDALQSGSSTSTIPGLLSLDAGGETVGGPVRPRIRDLDTVPFPRRDLIPMDQYFKGQKLYSRNINNMRIPKTTMVTSRGCPGNCVFCANRDTWGRRWVGRSPGNVVDEIEALIEEYGIKEIDFMDDTIGISRERLRGICELIIEREIDIKWTTPNGIAVWTLDEELLDIMKKAGCYRLTFGLESGDPDTLAFIRKSYDIDNAKRIIKHANRIGMWTLGTFIIGFPYETEDQIENTIRFAITSGLDLAIFYCANLFPSTDLYKICLKEGLDVESGLGLGHGVETLHFTAKEIGEYRWMASHRFLKSLARRPWKPLSKIRSIEDLRYTLRVLNYGVRMLPQSFGKQSCNVELYSVRK